MPYLYNAKGVIVPCSEKDAARFLATKAHVEPRPPHVKGVRGFRAPNKSELSKYLRDNNICTPAKAKEVVADSFYPEAPKPTKASKQGKGEEEGKADAKGDGEGKGEGEAK